jgi:hypothetical protein
MTSLRQWERAQERLQVQLLPLFSNTRDWHNFLQTKDQKQCIGKGCVAAESGNLKNVSQCFYEPFVCNSPYPSYKGIDCLLISKYMVVGELFQRTVIPELVDGCSKPMEEYNTV